MATKYGNYWWSWDERPDILWIWIDSNSYRVISVRAWCCLHRAGWHHEAWRVQKIDWAVLVWKSANETLSLRTFLGLSVCSKIALQSFRFFLITVKILGTNLKHLLEVKTNLRSFRIISYVISKGYSSAFRCRSFSLSLIAPSAIATMQSFFRTNRTLITNCLLSGLDCFSGSGRYFITWLSSLTSFKWTFTPSSLNWGSLSWFTRSFWSSFFVPLRHS